MHNTSHHRRHSQHSEVLLWNVNTYLFHIPHSGKEETSDGTDEQRWCESTAAATATVCSRRCEHLSGEYKENIEHQPPAVTGKDRVVHHLSPVSLGLSIKKDVYAGVALAVERRKKEYQHAEDDATQ